MPYLTHGSTTVIVVVCYVPLCDILGATHDGIKPCPINVCDEGLQPDILNCLPPAPEVHPGKFLATVSHTNNSFEQNSQAEPRVGLLSGAMFRQMAELL